MSISASNLPAMSTIAMLCAVQLASAELRHATIPLCPGLTIVTAINTPEGDYESIKRVESIDADAIHLKLSAQRRIESAVRNIRVSRAVLHEDLRSATFYAHHFNPRAPIRIPNSTALGASSAVLTALKTNGFSELAIVDGKDSTWPSDANVHPNVYDFQMRERIERVGSSPVMVSVIVNDVKVELPTIQARADFIGDKAEFFFLDDERNPLALKYRIDTGALDAADPEALGLQVVKISHRCSDADAARPDHASAVSRLEQALLKTGRAEVYDIYFDFNSERIREESVPTMREIGELMRRHPEWKLTIEGHTDSIASDAYNLDLSGRRSGAVKNALVATYGVGTTRLSASGAGESRPKDRNDTLEGRARNRRVELVRQL